MATKKIDISSEPEVEITVSPELTIKGDLLGIYERLVEPAIARDGDGTRNGQIMDHMSQAIQQDYGVTLNRTAIYRLYLWLVAEVNEYQKKLLAEGGETPE